MKQYRACDLGIDIDAVQRDIAGYRGLPLHTYTDPAIFDFEMAAIFDRSWQYFAPLEKLEKPGDVVTGTAGRTPIIVTRDENGELHGLINACRHRGHTVADGDKTGCKLLRCPYHAWAFRLDGSLAAAPETDRIPGFDKSAFGLRRVSVEAWAQGVFVNPEPDAPPLHEAVPELQGWAGKIGFNTDPSRYRIYRETVLEQRSNWKLWYDNGTECYHCPTVHGESFASAYDVSPEAAIATFGGRVMSYRFGEKDAPRDGTLRAANYHSYQLFPGAQIIQQAGIMILARVVPLAPDRTQFLATYLAEDGADPAEVDRWIDLWERTYHEDAAPTEVQQENLTRGAASQFVYLPGREDPSMFINRLIWDAYKANLTPDPVPRIRAAE